MAKLILGFDSSTVGLGKFERLIPGIEKKDLNLNLHILKIGLQTIKLQDQIYLQKSFLK